MQQQPVDEEPPAPNQQPVAQPQPARRAGQPWWIWLLVLLGLSVPTCGVVSALALYGVRKYVANAKHVEGRSGVGQIATGIARCAASNGELPETSEPVPAELSSVSGKKYQSAPSEWSDAPAFLCAGFSIISPQYFQYRWVRESESQGYAEAVCDLDGNGVPDKTFRVGVRCSSAAECEAVPPVEEIPPR